MMLILSDLVIDDGRIGRLLIPTGRVRSEFVELTKKEYEALMLGLRRMAHVATQEEGGA